jgi:hypothetical protein
MATSLLRTLSHLIAPLTVGALTLPFTGCLDRPISPARPETTNLSVQTLENNTVDKIDLLFMIDNSGSMGDKQQILAQAVPALVGRLATPRCVDDTGMATGEVSDASGHCAHGRPEFTPIKDIHVGVITSSLGSHGGTQCLPGDDDQATHHTPDDRAELLPTANPLVRGPLDSYNGTGFLAWDPTQTKNSPPGDASLGHLTDDFRDLVQAAGENGCGYEASLESWYRFLVDPEPPQYVTSAKGADGFTRNVRGPVNQAVLAQRKAFLRPDSLVAIVMLTDENDCSINDDDGAQGFLVSDTQTTTTPIGPLTLPRASAVCASAPDDPCCHSCAAPAPAGCMANEEDAECSKKDRALLPRDDDPNLRCFEQKRRFGLDLLYPTARYVDALTKPKVRNRAGLEVPNPLFEAPPGQLPREKGLVLLAGIVGVPWQDIASESSLKGDGLTYLTADELAKSGRWDVILGGKDGPSDPLMREQVAPRTGVNPIIGAALAPPSAADGQNPINGHEQNVVDNDDLQYACTFELPTPRPCDASNSSACDCSAKESANERPLCSYPNGTDQDGIQHAAKAYPGLRELAVLRGLEHNAVVASICPKHTLPAAGLSERTDPSYGYNPAIAAIEDLVTGTLVRQCLPRPLAVSKDASSASFGQIPCAVVEAVPRMEGASCGCDPTHGRLAFGTGDEKLGPAVRDELRGKGRCDGDSGLRCDELCLCKVAPLVGTELTACQNGTEDARTFGYCYVDPGQGIGNPALVKSCPRTTPQSLRFVGDGLPADRSTTFIACQGGTIDDSP